MATDWRDEALCRPSVHRRPEMFYPLGIEKEPKVESPAVGAAKAFCRPCPVRDECLREALDRREEWGIWGGLTPVERKQHRLRQILREQFPPVAELARELPGVRDRARRKGRPKKAHCVNGHPFDAANTYMDCRGFQACRACHADRSRARRDRDREAKRAAVTSC